MVETFFSFLIIFNLPVEFLVKLVLNLSLKLRANIQRLLSLPKTKYKYFRIVFINFAACKIAPLCSIRISK